MRIWVTWSTSVPNATDHQGADPSTEGLGISLAVCTWTTAPVRRDGRQDARRICMDSNELVRRRVATIPENETVAEAARRMRDLHVDDLVVMREGSGNRAPVGVLTDRDILAGIIQRGAFSLAKLRVSDMMTKFASADKQ